MRENGDYCGRVIGELCGCRVNDRIILNIYDVLQIDEKFYQFSEISLKVSLNKLLGKVRCNERKVCK